MYKFTHHLLALLLVVATSSTFAQDISKSDIDKAIDINSLEHPYLYFNKQDKVEILKRIETDKESNDILRKMKAQAKMWLSMPVDRNIPIQGKNTRAGWSEHDLNGEYGRYYSKTRNNAYHLAFLYQMTGEQKYADKAFEFADAFCDLTTWTQRAHEFPIIYTRIMPWNVPDDQVNFNFDHYNGDSGRMIAAVYDWLYPALNQVQRDRIRGALLEKVITRVRGDYEFHWWATAYRCNWNGVCNSGVGLAGLTLLKEHPQLADVVAESYNRINKLFNQLGQDGGWQEGGGYWRYGVETSSFFADALKRLTKSKYNLFENKRLKSNPTSFGIHLSLPGDKSLNFADSKGNNLVGNTFLINKLANETKNPQAAWYRKMFDEGEEIFDLIWERPTIKAAPPKVPSKHFRTIDWWVMRSDFTDPDKVLVAGKAGMNDDPHHGHLDIGHFITFWKGEYYIQDQGRIGYDEKYFDEVRFDYPEASSAGHNTVLVNGEIQISGKYYKKPYDYSVGGKVLEFRASDNRDYVLMDPTNAYPKKELKKWRRHVVLDKPQVTIVLDEITADSGDQIEVRFHPGVDYSVEDGFVLLEGEKGKMALIPVLSEDFDIKEGRHASQFVHGKSDFHWLPYFDTEVKAKGANTIVGTIILPVSNAEEAKKIAASRKMTTSDSGAVTVDFSSGGQNFSFSFEKSGEGLVLKK
ncbi:MAG: heparinase II/III family protein [Cyclobacteriaceae bacterium]